MFPNIRLSSSETSTDGPTSANVSEGLTPQRPLSKSDSQADAEKSVRRLILDLSRTREIAEEAKRELNVARQSFLEMLEAAQDAKDIAEGALESVMQHTREVLANAEKKAEDAKRVAASDASSLAELTSEKINLVLALGIN